MKIKLAEPSSTRRRGNQAAQLFAGESQILLDLRRFYAEELMTIVKRYPRNTYLGITILFLKTFWQILLILNTDVEEQLIGVESYLEILRGNNINEYLTSNKTAYTYCTVGFLCFNAILILYFLAKAVMYIADKASQTKAIRLRQIIEEREAIGKEAPMNTDENIVSFILQIYLQMLMIPSIIFSTVELDEVSVVNLVLTALISISISHNEYDYMIQSKDALRRKHHPLSFLHTLLEIAIYIAIARINNENGIYLLLVFIAIDICFTIYSKLYFDRITTQFFIFLNCSMLIVLFTFVALFSISSDAPPHLLSILLIIEIPITYKLSLSIEALMNDHDINKFKDLIYSSEQAVPIDLIDKIVRRMLLSSNTTPSTAQEEIDQYTLILSALESHQQDNIGQSQYLYQSDALNNNYNNNNNNGGGSETATSMNNIAQLYQGIDEIDIEGVTYISKETAYGDNHLRKKEVYSHLREIYQNQLRKNKEFNSNNIFYLIFIVEVLNNFNLFDLTLIQMRGNIDLKFRQILSSIKSYVDKKKISYSKHHDPTFTSEDLLFDTSYLEALVYDELIEDTSLLMEQTIVQKMAILTFLKQRHIDLELLRSELEKMQCMREDLISRIIMLVKVNEFNVRLFSIYEDYLDTLSFSESDIRLDNKSSNKYTRSQRKIYFQMNALDCCVVFASFKDKKQTRITKLSNNIEGIFGYSKKELIGSEIERLMPECFHRMHRQYVSQFFQRGELYSNLQQKQVFAIDSSNHLLSVQVAVKVNYLNLERDFGITAQISMKNRGKSYILIDSTNAQLISMTSDLHQGVFNAIKQFQRIGMSAYFPFLQHFRISYFNSSSNVLSGKSSKHSIGSVRTKQINSNPSVRSQNNQAKKPMKAKPSKHQPLTQQHSANLPSAGRTIDEHQQHLMYDEYDDRRYQSIQFLLVLSKVQRIDKKSSTMNSTKASLPSSLADFSFFVMNLSLYSVDSVGLEKYKYIEITNVKLISPLQKPRLILAIYHDEYSNFLSNIHHMRSSDINVIVGELEQQILRDSSRAVNNRHAKMQMTSSALIAADIDQTQLDNQMILYNRQQSHSNYFTDQQQHVKSSQRDLFAKQSTSTHANRQSNKSLDETDHQLLVSFKDHKNNSSSSMYKSIKSTTNIENAKQWQIPSKDAAKKVTLELVKEDAMNDQMIAIESNSQNQLQQHPSTNLTHETKNNNLNTTELDYSQTDFLAAATGSKSNKQQHDFFFDSSANLASHQMFSPQSSAVAHIPPILQQALPHVNHRSSAFVSTVAAALISPQQSHPNMSQLSKLDQSISQSNQYPTAAFNNSKQAFARDLQIEIGSSGDPLQFLPNNNQHQLLAASNNFQSNSNTGVNQNPKQAAAAAKAKQWHDVKHLKEALDHSSNHSRESSQSSTRKSTKRIILQRQTLAIMRIVNLVGMLSFLVILIVVLQQYLSMKSEFDTFNADFKLTTWATSYEVSLAAIQKHTALLALAEDGNLVLSADSTLKAEFIANSKAKQLVSNSLILSNLVTLVSNGADRQLIQRMLDESFTFYYSQVVNWSSGSLTGVSSTDIYNLVGFEQSLYDSVFALFNYVFMQSHQLGTGMSKFVAMSNADTMIDELDYVTEQTMNSSIDELNSISTSLTNLIVIICLISALCIFIVIPMYAFLQSRREQLIQLFATFSIGFLDQSIEEMKIAYQRQSIRNSNKEVLAFLANNDNQKRQNLSSTTKLNRQEKTITILTFFAFFVTLPYPILNKFLSQSFIDESYKQISTLQTIIQMEAVLEQQSEYIFGYVNLRFGTSDSDVHTAAELHELISTNFETISQKQQDLQKRISTIRQSSHYDQDIFDNYLLAIFEGDICEIQFSYPQYLVELTDESFTKANCESVMSGTLKQGLSISIKASQTYFQELFQIAEQTSQSDFEADFITFQNNNDISELIEFCEDIINIFDALKVFLKDNTEQYKLSLQSTLFALLIYEFAMMLAIFLIGWVNFYRAMDANLHKTKLFLAVMNLNYLVQNPYIQNYLHNNLT